MGSSAAEAMPKGGADGYAPIIAVQQAAANGPLSQRASCVLFPAPELRGQWLRLTA